MNGSRQISAGEYLEADLLLSIDTSTHWVGLALYDGVDIIAEQIWQARSRHTVEVAPAIASLLQHCGLNHSNLQAVGVALGPGSFTSLRIGLAAAKGLALALRLPVIGVPSLDVLAASQPVSEYPLAAVLTAGRGRLAVGWYRTENHRWLAQGETVGMTAEELSALVHSPTHIAGELTAHDRQVLARKRRNILLASPAQSLRRPSFLAELAWQRLQQGQVDEVISLSPIYLPTAEGIPG